jgi:hypothetical protein
MICRIAAILTLKYLPFSFPYLDINWWLAAESRRKVGMTTHRVFFAS